MKYRPILFSGEMVRALLAGRKTQTRRICKPAMESGKVFDGPATVVYPCPDGSFAAWYGPNVPTMQESQSLYPTGGFICQYGTVGDRLWVRETWVPCSNFDPSPETCALYRADGHEKLHWRNIEWRWKPSIHMPRWASRITLEITGVRVERLDEISESDAHAEGCDGKCPVGNVNAYQSGPFGYHYAQLWQSINGPDSWAANPWVWVVEFRRVDP